MKKIYLSLLAVIMLSQTANAQLSLTQAFNVPVVGNINSTKGYDSVGVIPKNIGAGLTWNFSAFTQNTVVASSSYSNPASVPSSSAYPGVTIVEDQGSNSYNYWKSTSTPTTQYELLGIQSGTNIILNFSNTAIAAIWPVSFGYNNTDNFAGTASGALSGPVTGTNNTKAVGTGTLIIPGGTNFTNILQIQTTQTLMVSTAAVTLAIYSTDYSYYHSSNKFELLNVSYQKQILTSFLGPTVTLTADTKVNNAVITGLNDKNFDATFQIFPNPAKDYFNVNLSNASNMVGNIAIYNSLGQIVKTIDLGNEATIEKNISITDLKSGIYIVKTTLGNKLSSRRLIIE